MIVNGYDVVVVDPPWKLSKTKRKARSAETNKSPTERYPCLSLKEIKDLPISKYGRDKSVLFLWVVDRYLMDSRAVLDAWGYKYHVTCAWNKNNGMNLFGFHRKMEYLVVGFRGAWGAFPGGPSLSTYFEFKSPEHSAKPDEVYNLIADRFPGKRAAIFERKHRPRYDCFGDELDGRDIREVAEDE